MKQVQKLGQVSALSLVVAFTGRISPALAESTEDEALDSVEVVSVTPLHGIGLSKDKIPSNVQTATSTDLDRSEVLDLTSYMNRNLGSVTINAAQNNPLQPDFNFRGFTASPLLGLAQGLTVYVNGVRFNDPFGDTVNWDMLPESIIHSVNLFSGANPLFGLNTLGGAISIETKNGFNSPGHELEVYGGAFGRNVVSAETGGNNGSLGYFINVRHFGEDGWRDASPSEALNVNGSLGWRGERSTLDLHVLYGYSNLVGNGAIPVELLGQNREAIFTSPDITRNDMKSFTLEGTHWLNDKVQFSANGFYRDTVTHAFNGDGSIYLDGSGAPDDGVPLGSFGVFDAGLGEVGPAYALFPSNNAFFSTLAHAGVTLESPTPGEPWMYANNQIDSAVNPATGNLIKDDYVLRDQNGNAVGYDDPNRPLNAVNNISKRGQKTFGGTAQTTIQHKLFGLNNQLILGAAYQRGLVNFTSEVEIARLLPNRSTQGTGLFIPADATGMGGVTSTTSGFVHDTLDLTDTLSLTAGGRYNYTNLQIRDILGNGPELNGDHYFQRFNPSAGLTWKMNDKVTAYGGYSESARAPTIVELACADREADCRLPNAFLADPPLDQVVAESFEAGLRGAFGKTLAWNLGIFHTINRKDIIFQATGGATSNIGFFDNIGDTRRMGLEAGLSGLVFDDWRWFLRYSLVDATFRNNFFVSSPTHPNKIETWDATDYTYSAVIPVEKGDHIPGIAKHSLKVGLDVPVTRDLAMGADGVFNTGQYLRGDEGNFLDQTKPYFVLNIHANYQITDHLSAFMMMENALNSNYQTFGILGEPNEIPGFENFHNPRFQGPAPPFGAWVGFRYKM